MVMRDLINMFGPIFSTILGAGIKLIAYLVNFWIEQKRMDRQLLAARDEKALELIVKNQSEQAKDPFVKVSRRILFLTLTFTYCYLMIFYAFNPDISYDVLKPVNSTGGFFSWFVGDQEWQRVTLTGGLLLASFVDLMFMVIGFYAIPSKRR